MHPHPTCCNKVCLYVCMCVLCFAQHTHTHTHTHTHSTCPPISRTATTSTYQHTRTPPTHTHHPMPTHPHPHHDPDTLLDTAVSPGPEHKYASTHTTSPLPIAATMSTTTMMTHDVSSMPKSDTATKRWGPSDTTKRSLTCTLLGSRGGVGGHGQTAVHTPGLPSTHPPTTQHLTTQHPLPPTEHPHGGGATQEGGGGGAQAGSSPGGPCGSGGGLRRVGKRSRYNGVSWIEGERKWVARYWDTERKEQRTLGRYGDGDVYEGV